MPDISYLLSEGGNFPPLATTGLHRKALRRAVLSAIRSVIGGRISCLTLYSDKDSDWIAPPLYSGEVRGVPLQILPDVNGYSMKGLRKTFMSLLHSLIEHGWTDRFENQLAMHFGHGSDLVRVFDRSSNEPARFAAEFAVAFSSRIPEGLRVGSGTAMIRIPYENGHYGEIGVRNGELIGFEDIKVHASELFDWLSIPKGFVTTKHYGVYDRIGMWLEEAFTELDDVDQLRVALSILKLSDKPLEEWQFEQQIRKIEGKKEVIRLPPKFNMDFLDGLRSDWYAQVNNDRQQALYNLFTKLVPDMFDSQEFISYFGHLPVKGENPTKRMLERINRGVEKFAIDFMSIRSV